MADDAQVLLSRFEASSKLHEAALRLGARLKIVGTFREFGLTQEADEMAATLPALEAEMHEHGNRLLQLAAASEAPASTQ